MGLKGPEIFSKYDDEHEKLDYRGEILLIFSRNWFPDVSYLPSQSCDVCPPHYQIARGSHEGRLHLAMMMVLLATMILIMMKMAIILPTGQWYAPSAVINDAWYCMVLHCIA